MTEPRGPRRSRRPSGETEQSLWSRRLLIGIAAALLPELLINVFANAFSDTQLGKWLGEHVAEVVIVVGVLVGGLLLGRYLIERRRPRPSGEDDRPAPDGFELPLPQPLPVWYEFPTRLHGREREIRLALRVVQRRGMVAVVGPRDIGTSAVANVVVAQLLADGPIGADAVVWVDLRGRSSTEPPDARSVAGRLLSTFDLDEPADDTPPVLADAAARLVSAMRRRPTILLLDNVFHADQVSWLTQAWPADNGLPMLVVAGDRPVAQAVNDDIAVRLDALELPAMRAILSDEAGDSMTRRWTGRMRVLVRGLRRDPPDPVDELLLTFRGRPTAVRDIARLLRRFDGGSWSLNLTVDQMRSPGAGNAPLVVLWTAVLPQLVAHLPPRAVALMRALAVLPVTGLGRGAMDALLTPGPLAEPDAKSPVDELRDANVVQESPPGRFRLPEEVRLAIRRVDGTFYPDSMWVAVAGLVHYYAVRATNWADALRTVTDARSAIVWLHQEEPLLRALLTDWRADASPPDSLLDDLAAIADALDAWYVRELQSDGLVRTSRGLIELATRAGRPELVRLAELRIAAAHRIGTHLDLADRAIGPVHADDGTDRHPVGFALRARWHNERALIEFDRASAVGDDSPAAAERLQAAEHELRLALAAVPADDETGRICVLVNLAAVCLEQRGRITAAVELLDRAYDLARPDASATAHVVELQGVAALREDRDRHAVELWQRALGVYRDLGEEQGQARCLQHLGTLALTRPRTVDLLDPGDRLPAGPDRAARVARDYLLRSKRLRAGQPNPTLVDHYLQAAEARLDP